MINGSCLRDAIISSSNNLAMNKSFLNDLNIFPVPDGDTGTNMSMTMEAALHGINNLQTDHIGEVAKAIASYLLRGARGNSGVILSLLFKGFANGLNNIESADGKDLVKALGLGVDAAYNAVMNPTEGTILTVARVAYEQGKVAALFDNDPIYVWESICKGAQEALESTPELLPVLKKAGVVDAGGQGLCFIFEGMMSVFKYGIITENIQSNENQSKQDQFALAASKFDEDITFTYCTEIIIERDSIDSDPILLRKELEQIGDCVVVVDDEEIIKVHVHTEKPGLVLQEGLKFGQLLTVKIDNMKEQMRLRKEEEDKLKLAPVEPTEEFGFVAVAAGDGVKTIFEDLGCLNVVTGGQTMNPSTENLVEAILATPAKTVYVLPNNKNIILAAEQTIPMIQDRRVIVVPTKTIPQGISAMLAFDPEFLPSDNLSTMIESLNKVSTGQITFAARDSEFGSLKIKEGDIIALDNGKLVFSSKDVVKAAIKLTSSMAKHHTEFITLIYGDGINEDQAEEVRKSIQHKVGLHVDITVIEGKQPIYHFIISVE